MGREAQMLNACASLNNHDALYQDWFFLIARGFFDLELFFNPEFDVWRTFAEPLLVGCGILGVHRTAPEFADIRIKYVPPGKIAMLGEDGIIRRRRDPILGHLDIIVLANIPACDGFIELCCGCPPATNGIELCCC
jgi:hypothetical protein